MKKRFIILSGVIAAVILAAVCLFLPRGGEKVAQDNDRDYAGKVLALQPDGDPYTGKMEAVSPDGELTLDEPFGSIGLDLGDTQKVNTVILTDDNGKHRMGRGNLSLYTSADGESYDRVSDFELCKNGNTLILYGFEAECRFVKIHSHFGKTSHMSFTNGAEELLKASWSALPGNGGGNFAGAGTVTLMPELSGEDRVGLISYKKLRKSAFCGDYRDLRFVLNGKCLPYSLEEEGIAVLLPEVTAGKTVTLTVYGRNKSALPMSDPESVFERVYGTRTVMELTSGNKVFAMNIAVATAPNGDVIAIGDDTVDSGLLSMRRSEDGGRTWGKETVILNGGKQADGGGLLVDQNTVWYFFHYRSGSFLKPAVIRSEDNGYTWSEPEIVQTGHAAHAVYCDGVKLSSYDGDGPEVDYVWAYHFSPDGDNAWQASAIYSTDNGKTWQSSRSCIRYGGESAFESGISESAIAELSNGDLLLLARCQYEGVDVFARSVSHDHGVTWQEEAELSDIPTVNTMPTLKNYGDDILLLWAGNNDMGGTSYMRFPLTLAYSEDDGENWQQKLDLWHGTEKGNYFTNGDRRSIGIQPSMTVSDYRNDGKDLFVAWWENWETNWGMLIEDAEDFLYKTKGAADTFENCVTPYNGWCPMNGTAVMSDEEAVSGESSLKLEDASQSVLRVSRSVPAMKKGEISFAVKLEKAESGLYVELKSAMNADHFQSTVMGFVIHENGLVTAMDTKNGESREIGSVDLSDWNRLTVRFDTEAGKAELFCGGESVGELPVNGELTSTDVCFVHLCDGTATTLTKLKAYVDDFRAFEGYTAK